MGSSRYWKYVKSFSMQEGRGSTIWLRSCFECCARWSWSRETIGSFTLSVGILLLSGHFWVPTSVFFINEFSSPPQYTFSFLNRDLETNIEFFLDITKNLFLPQVDKSLLGSKHLQARNAMMTQNTAMAVVLATPKKTVNAGAAKTVGIYSFLEVATSTTIVVQDEISTAWQMLKNTCFGKRKRTI